MPIERIELSNFTAFTELDFRPSAGINVLIGANATGKTHLLKVGYAACVSPGDTGGSASTGFSNTVVVVFRPQDYRLEQLMHRRDGANETLVTVTRDGESVQLIVRNDKQPVGGRLPASPAMDRGSSATYIPAKEMLAHAPGFRSLYAEREVYFEQVYLDIIDRAFLPPLRELDEAASGIMSRLEEAMHGNVATEGEAFFLETADAGRLEFMLVAEGHRKLGLLWLLVRNGSLRPGSVLFWDEPDANLNPALMGMVVDVLLKLQRMGVQVFLATHNYVILKEFDLQRQPEDQVAFHALYRDEAGDVRMASTDNYLDIHPNAIADTFASLYEREMQRALRVEADA